MMTFAHPWDNELDEDAFEASELVCLLRRDHNGVWNGYAGVSQSHPLYGKRRDVLIVVPATLAGREVNSTRVAAADTRGVLPRTIEVGVAVPLSVLIDVHGGLWSTGILNGDNYPGLWFYSFMCGHASDFKPLDPMTVQAYQTDPEQAALVFRTPAEYRTYDYARAETEKLAQQLAALHDVALAEAAQ